MIKKKMYSELLLKSTKPGFDLAGERQKYICQAQSLNLFFPPDVEVRRLNNVHKRAWTKGLKTLYYLRSEAIRRAENISVKVERQVRADS